MSFQIAQPDETLPYFCSQGAVRAGASGREGSTFIYLVENVTCSTMLRLCDMTCSRESNVLFLQHVLNVKL